MISGSPTWLLLGIIVVLVLAAPGAHAFGAGEIPDYAYLADKAFRHGDLENTLRQLAKVAGHHHHGLHLGAGAAGILSGLGSAFKAATGSDQKFSSMDCFVYVAFLPPDVKRVYLGNFLCDYSQCMDIAGLTKLTADSLVTIVMALGFMTFGFATAEFQITKERLGCYLCTTHIDNPKGYGEGQDPRDVYPGLRPPVEPEELELNDENGMKNYIATEGRSYDTSTALLKRVFRQCIEKGRQAQGQDGEDLFEAFRLLGQGLHTCEDLLAHSNWCELSLHKLGHQDVFCHVGDRVRVNSPEGPVPPLITGTFGSADFIHSLLGEATDHLSEASLTDLTKRLNSAKNTDQSESPLTKLIGLFKMMPSSGGEEKLQKGETMKAKAVDLNGKIDQVAPEEVQAQLWEILVWRDELMQGISETIANVPGLEQLLEDLTASLNIYVFTILEPFMTPILQSATGTLQTGSAAVIDANHEDQYAVFDDENASDPCITLTWARALIKDHFALILNEPAGLVAIVVVKHVVNLVVQAWYSEDDIDRSIEQILEVFHHPYYASGNSQIHRDMADALARWINAMSEEDRQITLNNLTKQSVRDGKNKRAGHEDDDTGVHNHANVPQYNAGIGRAEYNPPGGQNHGRQQQSFYGRQENEGYDVSRHQNDGQTSSYPQDGERHEGPNSYAQNQSYGRGSQEESGGYGGRQEHSYGRGEESDYRTHRNDDPYGSTRDEGYSSRRREHEEPSHGGYGQEESSYEHSRTNEYGSPRREESAGYGGRLESSYGGRESNEGYSSRHKQNEYGRDEQPRHGGEYGQQDTNYYGHAGQNSYSSPRNEERSGYGQQEGGSYGRESHESGSWNTEESSGYGRPQYGGNEDETYGAERLNISEDGAGRRNEFQSDQYESQY